ncbi:MAG: hypothetical protein CVU09_11770 [Bacteroidetes bacterium HGW-Bacteroidetes-4]|jgi:hypothetical protein|nr:MAG: hypothetical protein CVU09_11770 [Bacteroidetes bacterium HGW-Bacteroidetes-4]
MNRIVLFLLVIASHTSSCKPGNHSKESSQSGNIINNNSLENRNSDTSALPIIQFEKTAHNFGQIIQGEKVSYTFTFKNIGQGDLIIKDAIASCGCTVPKYSRKPIKSGEEGRLEVIFDSNNRSGKQLKTVTVWTNCKPEQIRLQLSAEIQVLNK